MNATAIDALPNGLSIIYDGDCPLCNAFAQLYTVRANVGEVALLNAREHPALVTSLRSIGMEINDGMVVHWLGKLYWGADGMHILSVLGAESGFFNGMNRVLFRRARMAKFVYPILAAGRRGVLVLLGRKAIS